MKIDAKKNNGVITLNSETSLATLAFTGDLCPLNGYEKPFMEGNLKKLMPEILAELNNVDAHIINMESPLTERGETILKCGANFRANPACVNGLKEINATHACLANNHIKDFGEIGIKDTVNYLEAADIKTIGVVKGEKEVMSPYIFIENGLKICILNIAEAEFSYPTDDSLGASFFNEVDVIKKIQDVKNHVDIVVVVSHAGREYKFFPATWLSKAYRGFINAGAHMVIAHHPHVPQGIEIYKNSVIFYSLGNFIFDRMAMQSKLGPNLSFFVKCNFSKKGVNQFKIYPFQKNHDNSISLLKDKKHKLFLSFLDQVSEPFSNNKLSMQIWDEYVRGDSELYLTHLKKCIAYQPFKNSQESKDELAYLFTVLSMTQTHKQMVERIFRLLLDDDIKSDNKASEIIKSWELILKKIEGES